MRAQRASYPLTKLRACASAAAANCRKVNVAPGNETVVGESFVASVRHVALYLRSSINRSQSTIIIPSMTGDLELAPGSLPVPDDDRVWRLAAAWLLGYESNATRRNYALDLSDWLGFCESHQVDPCGLGELMSMPGPGP